MDNLPVIIAEVSVAPSGESFRNTFFFCACFRRFTVGSIKTRQITLWAVGLIKTNHDMRPIRLKVPRRPPDHHIALSGGFGRLTTLISSPVLPTVKSRIGHSEYDCLTLFHRFTLMSAAVDVGCHETAYKLVADLTRDIKCEVLKRSFDFVLDLSLGWSVSSLMKCSTSSENKRVAIHLSVAAKWQTSLLLKRSGYSSVSRNLNNLFRGLGLGLVIFKSIIEGLFLGITTPTASLHVNQGSTLAMCPLDRMHFLGRRASSGHNNSFYTGPRGQWLSDRFFYF